MKMPFGKYLDIELKPWLRIQVLAQIAARGINDDSERPNQELQREVGLRVEPAHVQALRHVVDLGYKTAARQCHPDSGGREEDMLILNQVARWLREQLSELRGRV